MKELVMKDSKINMAFPERVLVARKNKIYYTGFPFVLYLLLSPFYVLPSGLPQAADIIFTIFLLVFVFFAREKIFVINSLTKWGILFVSWVFAINLMTSFHLNSNKPLLPCLFYAYNLMVVFYLNYMCKNYKTDFLRLIFVCASISVLIQFFAVFALAGSIGGFRQVGFFNNPNQLGYYGLCSLGVCLLTRKYVNMSWISVFIVVISGFFLVLFSLSKAAILSSIFIIFGFIFNEKQGRSLICKKTMLNYILYLFLACALLILITTNINTIKERSNALINNVTLRLFQIGQQNDDSLEGRGYGRIIKSPYFIFIGAGEGLTQGGDPRYEDPDLAGEIHSSFGTLLFSYGFIGLSLFVSFLYTAIRKNKWVFMLPLLAACLYGLTHQGLRFTHFWILIATTYMQKKFI